MRRQIGWIAPRGLPATAPVTVPSSGLERFGTTTLKNRPPEPVLAVGQHFAWPDASEPRTERRDRTTGLTTAMGMHSGISASVGG